MNDRELVTSLAGLGLDAGNYRSILLLPLIEVAWADGRVQAAERRRIGEIARRYDIAPDDAWLQRWLSRRPSTKTFLAARTVLMALSARSERPAVADETFAPIETLDGLLDLCFEVAEAAGGLFGLAFTVEASERECMEQIAMSMALGPALPEPVLSAWRGARERRARAEAPTFVRRYGILDQSTASLRPPDGLAHMSATVLAEPTGARPTPAERQAHQSAPRSPARVRVAPERKAPPKPEPARAEKPAKPPRRSPSPEDADTLPFFDPVNVGTYALDPADEDR